MINGTLKMMAACAVVAMTSGPAVSWVDGDKIVAGILLKHMDLCGKPDLNALMIKAIRQVQNSPEIIKLIRAGKPGIVGYSITHDSGPSSLCVFKVDFANDAGKETSKTFSEEVTWEPNN